MLKGYIFDYVGERAPNQYLKTIKEITVGRTQIIWESSLMQLTGFYQQFKSFWSCSHMK